MGGKLNTPAFLSRKEKAFPKCITPLNYLLQLVIARFSLSDLLPALWSLLLWAADLQPTGGVNAAIGTTWGRVCSAAFPMSFWELGEADRAL